MAQDQERRPNPTRAPVQSGLDKPLHPNAPDTFEDLERAAKRGTFFGRFCAAFQGVVQNSRSRNVRREPRHEVGDASQVTADDLAMRRARGVKPQRMTVPEGVIIEGSMTSGSETEISGRVEGDVTVEGNLYLGASALISGAVRAASCRVEGLVEGRMECSGELQLGRTGRLKADAIAGKTITIAGQVFGNVASADRLHLFSTAEVTGDIRARRLVMEEGAVFNGRCAMRTPAQRSEK